VAPENVGVAVVSVAVVPFAGVIEQEPPVGPLGASAIGETCHKRPCRPRRGPIRCAWRDHNALSGVTGEEPDRTDVGEDPYERGLCWTRTPYIELRALGQDLPF